MSSRKRLCTALSASGIRTPPRPHLRSMFRPGTCAFRPPLAQHLLPSGLRPLSTTPAAQQRVMMGQGSAPSIAVQQKQAERAMMRSGDVLDLQGVLQETLVMPRGASLPGWGTAPRARAWLEWRRARRRLRELVTLLVLKWFYVRPRPRLERRRAAAIAAELYAQMNTALARGDVSRVRLAPGLAARLKARVAARPPHHGLDWRLHAMLSPPELVSFRFDVLPDPKGPKVPRTQQNGIVQAVVRLHSRQSLLPTRKHVGKNALRRPVAVETVVDDDHRAVEDPQLIDHMHARRAKDTVEYFVIQKMLRRGDMGEWMAWGTTEETTLDKLKARELSQEKALLGQ